MYICYTRMGYNTVMAKKPVQFSRQINTRYPAGMKEQLIAMAYYRGDAGHASGVVRDLLMQGIARFENSLDARSRERYEEILANVRESESLR